MVDITDPATRSKMMASIRGRDTTPEMYIRQKLWRRGLRYRLHVKGLAGKPDLVFPGQRVALFVHGCFWHQHGCANSKRPTSHVDFWGQKLDRNVERDKLNMDKLLKEGWRVGVVWECSIRIAEKTGDAALLSEIESWIKGSCTRIVAR